MGKDVQWAGSDKLVIIRDLKSAAPSRSTPASGFSPRFMEITALRGQSKVSFGGLLTVDAHVGMKLGEGAVLATGAKATAQLRTLDKGDEITVGSSTMLTATELRGSGGSFATRLTVLAGHLFSHVAPLTDSADRFEVQTGQMTSAVRGTLFFNSVDPLTGQLNLFVASGKVDVSASTTKPPAPAGESSSSHTIIYPAQQINLSGTDDITTPSVGVVDVNDFVQNASPDVIAELIKNKAAIDEENKRYEEELKKETGNSEGSIDPLTQEELDRLLGNFGQLIGNIAKDALEQGSLSKAELDQIIKEANQKLAQEGKKELDIHNVKPLDPTAGVDPDKEKQRQQELKRLEEEKKAKLQQEQKRLEQLESMLGSIMSQVEAQRKMIEQANRIAQEELQKKAAEALLKQLSAQQQEAFLKAKEEAELIKKMQEAGQLVTNETLPVPPPAPPVVSTPSTPEPPAEPKVEIHYSDDAATELRANIDDNYFQSLYFETENLDPSTKVLVKVTLEKNGEPVTGLEVQFDDFVVEYEGSFILSKSYDEDYTLAELQDPDNSPINYRSTLKDSGTYTEKTELLKVTDGDPVVLGSFTRTLTVTPDAVFSFDGKDDFYQNVEGLWKFQSNAYGLADESEVGYRITLTGPENEPAAGSVMRIFVSPHDAAEEPSEEKAILIETNNEGSALLPLSRTGTGTVRGWDLAGRGIDISLYSTFAVEGNYQLNVQLVQLDDNTNIGEPMQWGFHVKPTS